MPNLFYFLFNPNNTVVSLLIVLILLTLTVFFIPSGTAGTASTAGISVPIDNTMGTKKTKIAQSLSDFNSTKAVALSNSLATREVSNDYFSLTKSYCILVSMVPLLWSLYLWYLFDASGHSLQMVVNLERLHLSFGVDSVSLSLTLLTTALFPICLMLMRTTKGLVTFLLLEIVIYGALNVLDLLGFYILFEASLILLFLLIGRTPYGNIEAAYKIVLYTMAGSLVLLPIIFVLYANGGSTSLIFLMCNLNNISVLSPNDTVPLLIDSIDNTL